MPSAPPTSTLPSATPKQRQARAYVSSPEFELLLAGCAHASSDDRVREIVEGPLDWEGLARLAQHHGVVPQVYRRLSVFKAVPPAVLQMLQQHYESNLRQTLWLSRELIRVLNHLEKSGIEALPYKGPVLAEILYGNVAMRQFSDLDVLIHPSDLAKTRAALLELGYKPALELTRRQERAYIESGYEHTFDSAHGQNLLEMQWQILPRFYSIDFDVDGLFDRAVALSFGGHSLRTLCAEDLMLVLCVHAAKHGWVQLSWLCDIAELASSIDWIVVQKRAQRLGVERILAVTFVLADRFLGIPLPQPMRERIRNDRGVEELAERIQPNLAQGTEYDTESIAYFRLMANVRERWQDRFRFWWRLAITPSVGEWRAIRLPDLLFPLYRVVRLARLARRMVQALA
jgi:hypothetical protein